MSNNWDVIAPLIEISLPPITSRKRLRMSNVLFSILKEELTVWIFSENDVDKYLMTTIVVEDKPTLTASVLIYSFTSIGDYVVNLSDVQKGLKYLKKYAESINCQSIRAYVSNKTIIETLNRMGANSEFTLIEIGV